MGKIAMTPRTRRCQGLGYRGAASGGVAAYTLLADTMQAAAAESAYGAEAMQTATSASR